MGTTGLAQDALVREYATTVMKAKDSWTGLGEWAKIDALLAPANAALEKVGVPTVKALIDPLGQLAGTATRAGFNRATWLVVVNTDLLQPLQDDKDLARRANTFYHESRHAEQAFRVARRLAAEKKPAAEIAKTIGIPDPIAAKAVTDRLSTKAKDEWAETDPWLFTLQADLPGMPSRAETVNAAHSDAVKKYEEVRAIYRPLQMVAARDPAVSPELQRHYDEERAKKGGPERLDQVVASWKDQYVVARERAKQCFLMYAKMPIEQDAWAVGGLVETSLGLQPWTAEQELANLDRDERTMLPVLAASLMQGSDRDKALVAAISRVL